MPGRGALRNPGDADGPSLEDALELLAYLVTAADLCSREPLHYGMFRLIDGASRLARALETAGAAGDRPWVAELRRRIEADKELLMWDRPAFEAFLRETASFVALNMSSAEKRSHA